MSDLTVDSASESAEIIRQVLGGKRGPARDIVVLNAAAALAVAERGQTIAQCIPLAEASIDSGAAKSALEKLIAVSNT
jgi:anthranilate phosphoribosyltransferase